MPIDPVEHAVALAYNEIMRDVIVDAMQWSDLLDSERNRAVSAARASLQAHLEGKADRIDENAKSYDGDDDPCYVSRRRQYYLMRASAEALRHALDPVEETRP